MNDDKREEILFQINGKLSSIETKLDCMNEIIMKHESRLTLLEQNFNNHTSNIIIHKKEDENFKTSMLKLLGKCLLISITSIASLAGASGIVAKLFGF